MIKDVSRETSFFYIQDIVFIPQDNVSRETF